MYSSHILRRPADFVNVKNIIILLSKNVFRGEVRCVINILWLKQPKDPQLFHSSAQNVMDCGLDHMTGWHKAIALSCL